MTLSMYMCITAVLAIPLPPLGQLLGDPGDVSPEQDDQSRRNLLLHLAHSLLLKAI